MPTSQSKTFRRDRLRRLVEAGKVTAIHTYHFDDMYGESRTHGAMPVRMRPADWKDMKQGVVYMFPSDFTSKSGGCVINTDSTITLYVHSNSNYDFRVEGVKYNAGT
jgi:hypothetical protein